MDEQSWHQEVRALIDQILDRQEAQLGARKHFQVSVYRRHKECLTEKCVALIQTRLKQNARCVRSGAGGTYLSHSKYFRGWLVLAYKAGFLRLPSFQEPTYRMIAQNQNIHTTTLREAFEHLVIHRDSDNPLFDQALTEFVKAYYPSDEHEPMRMKMQNVAEQLSKAYLSMVNTCHRPLTKVCQHVFS